MATSRTAAEFKVDLDRAYLEEVQAPFMLILKKFSMEALSRVVMMSPVDTGRFRGNWSVAIGEPTRGPNTIDKGGEATVARGTAVIEGIPDWNKVVWVSNHLPYAEALENGHSQQAPGGMVAVTYAALATIVPTRPAE